MWISVFLLVMQCMTLIDLGMLNHPCDPGMNPTWLQFMIYLYINGFSFQNFVENFHMFIHQRHWPIILFFGGIFIWFWNQVMVSSQNVFGSLPSSSAFWKSLRRMGISSSFDVQQNLHVKPSGPGLLFVGSVSITYSISFLVIVDLFQLIYFFLILFWWAVCLQKVVPFFQVVKFVGM